MITPLSYTLLWRAEIFTIFVLPNGMIQLSSRLVCLIWSGILGRTYLTVNRNKGLHPRPGNGRQGFCRTTPCYRSHHPYYIGLHDSHDHVELHLMYMILYSYIRNTGHNNWVVIEAPTLGNGSPPWYNMYIHTVCNQL